MARIEKRLGVAAVLTPGATGQFDVMLDDEVVARRGGNWLSRRLGAGYPDLDAVVDLLEERLAR